MATQEKRKTDYSKTVMYYIEVDGKKYHGHTVDLRKRLATHKYDYKRHQSYPLYKTMHDTNFDIDTLQLIEVEKYPCASMQEAKERERWWIENHSDKSLHAAIPSRSDKEKEKAYAGRRKEPRKARKEADPEKYKQKHREKYEANKDYESERHKVWYAKNKEVVKQKYEQVKDEKNAHRREKVPCPKCGKEGARGNLGRHMQICGN
jgi:hypothetical protein